MDNEGRERTALAGLETASTRLLGGAPGIIAPPGVQAMWPGRCEARTIELVAETERRGNRVGTDQRVREVT